MFLEQHPNVHANPVSDFLFIFNIIFNIKLSIYGDILKKKSYLYLTYRKDFLLQLLLVLLSIKYPVNIPSGKPMWLFGNQIASQHPIWSAKVPVWWTN